MAAGWAVALNAPFGWMKQVPSDFGGTRNGMVVRWPKGIKAKNEIRTQFGHVIDVAPTVLQAIGLPEPKVVNGTPQIPMEGTSLVYSFDDAKAKERHTTQYFEIAGNRAIYHDGWFARTIHRAPWEAKGRLRSQDDLWELYDVRSDFSLANDLAAKQPKKLAELQALFMKEAAKYHVLPIDDRVFERMDAHLGRAPGPDGRPHLAHAGRRHDRHDGGRVHQREEPLDDHHRRSRGAARRRQRHDPRAGRTLRRLVAVREGRRARIRLQLPRPATPPRSRRRSRCRRASTRSASTSPTTAAGRARAAWGRCSSTARRSPRAASSVTQAGIFSADETADVGIDLGTPVVEAIGAEAKSRFTGRIPKVTIDVK